MLDYFLATYEVMGGALLRRVVSGNGKEDALVEAVGLMPSIGRLKPTLLSVEPVPQPRWSLVEPLRIAAKDRYTSLDVRNHFLKEGAVCCDLGGREYMAVAAMSTGDECKEGEPIGTAFLSCTEAPGRVVEFDLDGLDESHALEHLDSELIRFAAEIEHAAATTVPATASPA